MPQTFTQGEAKKRIDYLFRDFWPVMKGVTERYGDCLAQLPAIVAIVNGSGFTHDDRLRQLDLLSGVGPTIASGLLFAFFPDACVPFDKHTMGYCTLDWNIIPGNRITDGTYARKSAAVISALRSHDPPFASVADLVRYAADNRSEEVSPI